MAHKTTYFSPFIFHKDLPKNSRTKFSVILVFMQVSRHLRLVDYVILLQVTVLAMALKDLVNFISAWLVRLI